MLRFWTRHTKIGAIALFLIAFLLVWGLNNRDVSADILLKLHLPDASFYVDKGALRALTIGNYYFNVGNTGAYDLERSREYFYRAIEIDPMVPDAWHQLARIDFLEGYFEEGLTKINKQIENHGDSFMAAYYIRGLILGYMGRYDESEKDFIYFLEWDPKNWAAHNDLAWVYFSNGEYEKAKEWAEKGLELDPNNVWLLNLHGVSLLNLGDRESAKEAFLNASIRAEMLTEADWHKAYPGNHPNDSQRGLEEMKIAIQKNIELVGN